jgi:hypothetical protein
MKLKEICNRKKGTGVFLLDFSCFAVPKRCALYPPLNSFAALPEKYSPKSTI